MRSDKEFSGGPTPRKSPFVTGALRAVATPRSTRFLTPKPESESQLREHQEVITNLLSDPEDAGEVETSSGLRFAQLDKEGLKAGKNSSDLSGGAGGDPEVGHSSSIATATQDVAEQASGSSACFKDFLKLFEKDYKARFHADFTMMLTVSGLVITLAFASALQPPGGIQTRTDGKGGDVKLGEAILAYSCTSFRIFFCANGLAMAAASLAVTLHIAFRPETDRSAMFINVLGRLLVWLAVQFSLVAFCCSTWIVSGRNKRAAFPFWMSAGVLFFLINAMFLLGRWLKVKKILFAESENPNMGQTSIGQTQVSLAQTVQNVSHRLVSSRSVQISMIM